MITAKNIKKEDTQDKKYIINKRGLNATVRTFIGWMEEAPKVEDKPLIFKNKNTIDLINSNIGDYFIERILKVDFTEEDGCYKDVKDFIRLYEARKEEEYFFKIDHKAMLKCLKKIKK